MKPTALTLCIAITALLATQALSKSDQCCRQCVRSKACGNSCISRKATCTRLSGCACDYGKYASEGKEKCKCGSEAADLDDDEQSECQPYLSKNDDHDFGELRQSFCSQFKKKLPWQKRSISGDIKLASKWFAKKAKWLGNALNQPMTEAGRKRKAALEKKNTAK